jgi:trehalose-6-phosphate synthase
VPPGDAEAAAEAIEQAFAMPADERRHRWAGLRANVSEQDVFWWAESFQATLEASGAKSKLLV